MIASSSRWRVELGDSREKLRELADASVDAVVTDPPYEIAFMGRGWDASGVAYNVGLWREALRVLRPGGYLLAFGATRTYHRLAVAIEDAGFEIRDSIHWTYGSGFPKSLDVSKAIDRKRHDRDEILRVTAWIRERRDAAGVSNAEIDAAFGFRGMAGHWTSATTQPAVPTLDQVPALLAVLGVSEEEIPAEIRRLLVELNGRKGEPGEAFGQRPVVGYQSAPDASKSRPSFAAMSSPTGKTIRKIVANTEPATELSRAWQGWGTALKPAHEPIIVARKPLDGTVADNVLAHGVGGINVDGCRVPHATEADFAKHAAGVAAMKARGGSLAGSWKNSSDLSGANDVSRAGRWPPNAVFSHLPACEVETCVAGCPIASLEAEAAGASRFFSAFRYQAKASRRERDEGLDAFPVQRTGGMSATVDGSMKTGSGNDRVTAGKNIHPTVKPIELMRWLVRLVTPRNGLVLDPFAGSGTTGVACVLEDARFVGVELSPDYRAIALARIEAAASGRAGDQLDLF